jgi:hypothetical protein
MVQQHEIERAKVDAIKSVLLAGGSVPPVVVALYDDSALPIDGHHRMFAHDELGLEVDAWTITGRAYDRLCTQSRNPEAHILCGGVLAMDVAKVG